MPLLRLLALAVAALAVWTLLRPVADAETGIVFLGKRLGGAPNLIVSATFAVFLACYARALWRAEAVALPLAIAFGSYLCVSAHYGYLFAHRLPPGVGSDVFGAATLATLGAAWAAVAVLVAWRDHLTGERPPGRTLLRAFALLFALLALSNALKPFAYAPDIGFILFGHRLTGTANAGAALVFATLLAAYAACIWAERRAALPLGIAYAAYVLLNLLLFAIYRPGQTDAPPLFALPYFAGAIGVSSGAALLLWRHRRRLV